MIEHSVIFSCRRTIAIEIKRDGRVVVRAPYRTPSSEIERVLEEKRKWIEKHKKKASSSYLDPDSFSEEQVRELKLRAESMIPPLVLKYKDIVGVSPISVRINGAKKRFGSCSSKGRLNFSCFLALYPTKAIEYVVVHELAHVVQKNHSKAFWSVVEKYCPEWKQRRKWLKDNAILTRIF